jgi:phosphoribosylamine--glycine ligase
MSAGELSEYGRDGIMGWRRPKPTMADKVVLVVGGGGREHALCMELKQSSHVRELHCAPGNAGTSFLATNHPVAATDIDGLIHLASILDADLVVAGPEAPLCAALADCLESIGIPCFGPIAKLANLEGSKLHAKQVMRDANVPTAAFHVLSDGSDIEAALDDFAGNPWVVKRDVLAGGKGVVVTQDRNEARAFIQHSIQSDGQVLLEDFLPGEEASMLVIMDGSGFVCLPASQDHKRAYDGDEGPNTGGMGAYCPAPVVTDTVRQKTIDTIIKPMHNYLLSTGTPYRGVLYVGLMIPKSGEPNVVEFNVRFGDPECQITLPLIKTDVFELLEAASNDRLAELQVEFHDFFAATVVLAAEGYPESPVKGRLIHGVTQEFIQSAETTAWVNHAGTGFDSNGNLISTGGRVLSCSASGPSLEESVRLAYELIESIELDGSHYRKDIAFRAL